MGLELVVTERHLEILQGTKPGDRGYVLVERVENELWTMRIVEAQAGNSLILPGEIRKIIPHVLPKGHGYLPFIQEREAYGRFAEAVEIWKIDRKLGFNKFFGYGCGEELKFYEIEAFGDESGRVHHPLQISLKLCDGAVRKM